MVRSVWTDGLNGTVRRAGTAIFHNLAIVSDTHNAEEPIQAALRVFRSYNVERVLHCGDVCLPEILDYFRGVPTDVACGNCDRMRSNELRMKAADVGVAWHDFSGCFHWYGTDVFFAHGDDSVLIDNAKFSGEYGLICSGHSHLFDIERYEDTILLNPGSLQNGDCCIVTMNLDVLHINALENRIVEQFDPDDVPLVVC